MSARRWLLAALQLSVLATALGLKSRNATLRKVSLHSGGAAVTSGVRERLDPRASMFVAVFTKRDGGAARRDAIRDMWAEVDGGQQTICYRFVVCDGGTPSELASLAAEQARHGDMLTLACKEGYAQGLLTRKVLAAMRAFANPEGDACRDRALIFKTDDDTFVAGNRLRRSLTQSFGQFGEYSYMGVPLPKQYPIRDPSNKWYEPPEVFPDSAFPEAMYGGPGYILGRVVVQNILSSSIADSNILWNEDRAVGVWIKKLREQTGMVANRVEIPGTNGFDWDKPVFTGRWADYPYTLAHHLSPQSIQCLTKVDLANDPNILVDGCFQVQR